MQSRKPSQYGKRVWRGFFAAVLLLCFCKAVPVMAQTDTVIDLDGLFTSAEKEDLQEGCRQFYTETGVETAILTVDAATVGGYADADTIRYVEAYTDAQLGENAIVLIINMDARYYYIDIRGNEALAVYTDSRQEELGEAVVWPLAEGRYAEAGRTFLSTAAEQYRYAQTTGSYGTIRPEKTGFRTEILGVSGILSAIAAALMTRVRAGSHHEKQLATDADRYVVPGTVDLHVNRDTFVSQYVTRLPRTGQGPRVGGGGFTTTHMSGGGQSHSGHGGHF